MITLTVAEIVDLAGSAGLVINQRFLPDGDDLDTEIVVMECPKEGVLDDDGKPTHYAHIAYFADYPEEGSHPLGPELTPPNAIGQRGAACGASDAPTGCASNDGSENNLQNSEANAAGGNGE